MYSRIRNDSERMVNHEFLHVETEIDDDERKGPCKRDILLASFTNDHLAVVREQRMARHRRNERTDRARNGAQR